MPQNQFIRVGDFKARFWQQGDAGSPVVLVHGIGCSVLEWERNIEALARRHRVYAVDLLGYGLTDKPGDATYSLRQLAQFVLDFMTAAGLVQAHLAGNSLGGRLALQCAAMAPERVLSLLLVAPAGMQRRGLLFEFRLATLPVIGEMFTRPTSFGTRMLWRKAFADPTQFVTDDLVTAKLTLASAPGAQAAFLKTLRGLVDFGGFRVESLRDLHAALPGIKAPCLVLWGRGDRFVPASHADALKRALPEGEIQVWDRCGHVPQIECAHRFNETAIGFWDGVDSRSETLLAMTPGLITHGSAI